MSAGPPRLGFVGLGWIGAMRLEALAAAGAAVPAALCDPAPERLAAAGAAHPGAARCASFEELLARARELGLEGVVIATPNALHAPQTLAALDRGLAVFCQKPLALDAPEARRMVAAARAADRLLGVDYSYRGTGGARALRRLVAAGELGRLFHAEAAFHNAYGPDKPWCRDLDAAGGGALMDLGVHLVDLLLWLLGDPAVRAVRGGAWAAGAPLPGRGVDDFASARLELEGGGSAALAVSWNAHAGRDCAVRLALFGSGGGAELRNVDGSFYDFELVRFRGRQQEVVGRESREWLGRTALGWAERLAASRGYDPEVERAVAVAAVIDEIYGGGAGGASALAPGS